MTSFFAQRLSGVSALRAVRHAFFNVCFAAAHLGALTSSGALRSSHGPFLVGT